MPCIAYPGQFQFGTSWWVFTLHTIPWLWWQWSWRWCWSSPRGAWYACWAPRLSEQRSPHFGGSDELPTTDPWSIVQKSCGAPWRPPPVTQRRRLLETHTPPFPRAVKAYRQLPAHQFSAFCLGIIARDGQTGVPNNSIQCEWICRLNFPPEMRWTLFVLCVVWMKWNGETRSSWLNYALTRWRRKRGHAIKNVKIWWSVTDSRHTFKDRATQLLDALYWLFNDPNCSSQSSLVSSYVCRLVGQCTCYASHWQPPQVKQVEYRRWQLAAALRTIGSGVEQSARVSHRLVMATESSYLDGDREGRPLRTGQCVPPSVTP